MTWTIFAIGDTREMLSNLDSESVQSIITSPPYFGLRDYGIDGQIGLEASPQEYITGLVAIFRDCRRILRPSGTLWLNIGDSYAANRSYQVRQTKNKSLDFGRSNASKVPSGCKAKDLIGIPWMLAFALRSDGWYLRSDIIWHKPNALPESVKDRPTAAYEHIFLFSKDQNYFYDAATAHRYDVWPVTTRPFKGAHFATFPPELIKPCIQAGSSLDEIIFDPFGGSGTTALVANQLGRNAILFEINPDYAKLAYERLVDNGIKPTDITIC